MLRALPGLERFGYDASQAAFLTLVAHHSGYFLRRQYRAFVPPPDEASVVDFLHAVVAARHVVPIHLDIDTLAYHLTACAIYDALDMPDNQNRRRHERGAVLHRLMALDLILRYPMWRVLRGEAETVSFFTQTRGVAVSLLPATRYHHVRERRLVTVRHFIGDGPIFVPAVEQVVFSYLDVEDWTLGRWRAYVARLRRLWSALSGRTTVLFASTDAGRVRQAQRIWSRALATGPTGRPMEDVQADCQARAQLERGMLGGLSQVELDVMRLAARRVSGPEEAAYRAWTQGGEAALRDLWAAHGNVPQLLTWHVPYRYGTPLHSWGAG